MAVLTLLATTTGDDREVRTYWDDGSYVTMLLKINYEIQVDQCVDSIGQAVWEVQSDARSWRGTHETFVALYMEKV